MFGTTLGMGRLEGSMNITYSIFLATLHHEECK